jgi:hypothetical protein
MAIAKEIRRAIIIDINRKVPRKIHLTLKLYVEREHLRRPTANRLCHQHEATVNDDLSIPKWLLARERTDISPMQINLKLLIKLLNILFDLY